MRIVVRLLVLSIALAPAAHAAVVGTGDSIATAGGAGVDILVWRDAATGTLKAMRFDSNGAALDASGFDLQLPPGGNPSAVWDGSGFLIATTGSNALLARVPVTGGAAFTLTHAPSPPTTWSSVASKRDGTSLVAWSDTGGSLYAAAISATGGAQPPQLVMTAPNQPARLARERDAYLLAWVDPCFFPVCPPELSAYLLRLDDAGRSLGPVGTFGAGTPSVATWSLAGGERALLAASSGGAVFLTRLFSVDPGAFRAARTGLRFPGALAAQATAGGQALVGAGARIDISATGAPLTVNWAPMPDGMRLAAVLPSSGARVLAPEEGAGTLSVEAPASDVSEVGLTPVWISPDQVWLKVDNRGPDHARTIDVWLTGAVRSIASLVSGTVARHGALSRIRFNPTLKPGAGFEIAIYFEQPVDAEAFEAWALTLGTDRDATNNYVSTRADEPEPEQPRRRRAVRR